MSDSPSVAEVQAKDIGPKLDIYDQNTKLNYEKEKAEWRAKWVAKIMKPRWFGLYRQKTEPTDEQIKKVASRGWDFFGHEWKWSRQQVFSKRLRNMVDSASGGRLFLTGEDLQVLNSWQTLD